MVVLGNFFFFSCCRKFAFKAEHANMRTYFFAAETKDSMIQWMNSLSLASILQNENK